MKTASAIKKLSVAAAGATFVALGVTLANTSAANAANPTIFSQPSVFPEFGGGLASQNDMNRFGNFATGYDNFSFDAPHFITDVHWQGLYYNPPEQGTITGFTLSIFDDNAGQPGNLAFSELINGNAGETFVGSNGYPVYDYWTDLAGEFLAQAGSTYWLAVVPDLGFPPQWAWSGGTGGDGISYQDFLGDRSQVGSDMAFSLTGKPVPEPASVLGLLAIGALGAGSALKRKLK
jgi:hypothetical protein